MQNFSISKLNALCYCIVKKTKCYNISIEYLTSILYRVHNRPWIKIYAQPTGAQTVGAIPLLLLSGLQNFDKTNTLFHNTLAYMICIHYITKQSAWCSSDWKPAILSTLPLSCRSSCFRPHNKNWNPQSEFINSFQLAWVTTTKVARCCNFEELPFTSNLYECMSHCFTGWSHPWKIKK